MSPIDWNAIDAAVKAVNQTIQHNDAPGDHLRTLQRIEESLAKVESAGLTIGKLRELRSSASRFYGTKLRRRPVQEIEYEHRQMLGLVESIRLHAAMLRESSTNNAGGNP